MTRDLATVDHEPVGVAEALRIADEYFARGGRRFEAGEDALAATMFGFSASPTTFIELCAHGPANVSFKFETPNAKAPRLLRPWTGTFQHEETLRSREAMVECIRAFFDREPESYRAWLDSRPRTPG